MNSAIISDDKKYRYVLNRNIPSVLRWVRRCVFIMLNPSTADAQNDDPTIRRCIAFAKREGCTQLSVVNLFALRATDPKELLNHNDPVGPENFKYLILEIERADIVIAAWGSHRMADCSLARELSKLDGIQCLGKTKTGKPRHPLYVKSDQPLEQLNKPLMRGQ